MNRDETLPALEQPPHPVPAVPVSLRTGSVRWVLGALAARASRMGWRLNLALLVLTLGTTTISGGWFLTDTSALSHRGPLGVLWALVSTGLAYAVPVMLILGSHESGHYVACRLYGVQATLPYFLPAPPIFIFGTFGAVIRMRPPIPGRRALFDIGIAGPIAGFVVAIPILVFGIATAAMERIPPGPSVTFADPLLVVLLTRAIRGGIPEGYSLLLNPALFAGWFGLLVTAMNLFPVGQLDGGHVAYALSRRLQGVLSGLTVAGMIALVAGTALIGVINPWLFWTLILFFLRRFPHPPIPPESQRLGFVRSALGVCALAIFALCFMPIPIRSILSPG